MTAENTLKTLIKSINIKPVSEVESFGENDSRVYYEWFKMLVINDDLILRIDDPLNCNKSYDFYSTKEMPLQEKFNLLVKELSEFVLCQRQISEAWRKDEAWGTDRGSIEALVKIEAK